MMKALVFEVKGSVAHFRRPDTTATQLTYPFITPTAAKGLIGAILGITDFVTRDKVGIQLLSPVKTSAQQLSLLGKDSNSQTFNRPTTIELLVNPHYRIFYAGNEYVENAAKKIKNGQSVYPTYLGVAFALTFPKFIGYYDEVFLMENDEIIETKSVVPTHLIKELFIEEDCCYSRASGFMKHYLGNRTFEKSVSFLYEKEGRRIRFRRKTDVSEDLIVKIGGESVCLV